MEVLSSRIIIATEHLPRARLFYEGTLGLSIYREYQTEGFVAGVAYFLGTGFLELTTGTDVTVGNAVKLWLKVADVAEEERRLAQAGVVITKPAGPMPWGLDELWIEDPDGVEIRLIEVPPDHPIRRRVNGEA